MLFTKDTGGNERFHIYVRETDGTVKDLTPGDETRASFAGFTKNASQFFITSNQRMLSLWIYIALIVKPIK